MPANSAARRTPAITQRYPAAVSGPLLDRIVTHVEAAEPHQELSGNAAAARPELIRAGIAGARDDRNTGTNPP